VVSTISVRKLKKCYELAKAGRSSRIVIMMVVAVAVAAGDGRKEGRRRKKEKQKVNFKFSSETEIQVGWRGEGCNLPTVVMGLPTGEKLTHLL